MLPFPSPGPGPGLAVCLIPGLVDLTRHAPSSYFTIALWARCPVFVTANWETSRALKFDDSYFNLS